MTGANRVFALAATAAAIVIVELVSHGPLLLPYPFPETILVATLIVIAGATYLGGFAVGFTSAAIVSLYAFRFYAEPGTLLSFSGSTLFSFLLLAALAFGTAGTTGAIRRHTHRLTERALRAERERFDAVERTRRDLAAVNEGLQSFAYVVSHDLKEPVRAMTAYLEDAHDNASNPAVKASIKKAQAANEKLGALLGGLLEISRAARLDPKELRGLDVVEAIASGPCTACYGQLFRERAAKLDLPGSTVAPRVLATPSHLNQVLSNLLVNAVKHNQNREPRVAVRVSAVAEGTVEIVIEDNGPGLSATDARLFEQVRIGSATTLHGGFGFLIVSRAVDRLGGRIWATRSDALGGAAIHVVLPAAAKGS